MANGPYSRVYHVLMEEYPHVWKSDAQLALFIRLLTAADKWWPQMAPIGRRNGAYRSLVEAGLVLENEGATAYTMRGLGKARSSRSEHARHAVSRRWEYSENTQSLPSRVEKSKEEKSTGQSPTSFIRFPVKEDRAPGEAAMVRHDGTHKGADNCLVCHPVR
jgi:hypothetical protein